MTAGYTYNGDGQRVKKTVNGTTTIFHYDQRGQLIAESDGTGATTAEYIYLNAVPLAKIEGANAYYYANDHLGTPQKMTDATGTVVWSADYKPFGEATVTVSTITNNLRFPGQYFDVETGLNYNYYRDYNPVIGRYMEADRIGLFGGLNLYVYTQNNSINRIDPLGLYDHGEGGPWHPPQGVSVGCTSFDSCSELSNKMRLLKKMILSHVEWDREHDTNRHWQDDIPQLMNAYNNCVAIHQQKCVEKKKCEKCQEQEILVAEPVAVGVTAYVIYKVVKICVFTAAGGPVGAAVGAATP